MIWNVPIEPLEERYSVDWNRWVEDFLTRSKTEFSTISGLALTDKITTGSFLDVCGTNYYKASQLQKIAKLIYDGDVKDGDIFFFHDLWYPGLEMLAYMRDGLGIDFRITGCLHAGTWDSEDFLVRKGMRSWAQDVETSWFRVVDAIFVATEFHKKLILDHFKFIFSGDLFSKHIHVTGFPIYNREGQDELLSKPFWDDKKENIIVFPHRLDPEKQPELFDELRKNCEGQYPFKDWQFIKTKDVCKTKKEYYNLLRRAKIAVSFAKQETWGIAMQEVLFAGCIPVVPNKLSYKEMYNLVFRYGDVNKNEAEQNIRRIILDSGMYCALASSNRLTLLEKGAKALPKIFNIVRGVWKKST